MYTHQTKTTKQKCFIIPLWPTTSLLSDSRVVKREKARPLVMFESGQIDRVRRDNLSRLRDDK